MLLVWQNRDRNEWATAIRQTLTATTTTPTSGTDPFSLADPTITEGILTAAGFTEISFTDVHEPVYYGPDTTTAFDAVLRLLKSDRHLACSEAVSLPPPPCSQQVAAHSMPGTSRASARHTLELVPR